MKRDRNRTLPMSTTTVSRILVLHDSKTGKTPEMAQFVAEGAALIPDTEVRFRSLDEATLEDVLWAS
jgi:sulfite reductase alpha subunit-like flavoprotein